MAWETSKRTTDYLVHLNGTRPNTDDEGTKISIDIGIAPLIQALWEAGVGTRACCEGEWYIDDIDAASEHVLAYVLTVGYVLRKFELPRWMRVELSTAVSVWRFPKSFIPDLVDLADSHGVVDVELRL